MACVQPRWSRHARAWPSSPGILSLNSPETSNCTGLQGSLPQVRPTQNLDLQPAPGLQCWLRALRCHTRAPSS